jgi:hypothetical protein
MLPRKYLQQLPVDIPAPLCQHRTMLGETRKPILPHPHSTEYMRATRKQILLSSSAMRRSGVRLSPAPASQPKADCRVKSMLAELNDGP